VNNVEGFFDLHDEASLVQEKQPASGNQILSS
jgi:hypothetical protein